MPDDKGPARPSTKPSCHKDLATELRLIAETAQVESERLNQRLVKAVEYILSLPVKQGMAIEDAGGARLSLIRPNKGEWQIAFSPDVEHVASRPLLACSMQDRARAAVMLPQFLETLQDDLRSRLAQLQAGNGALDRLEELMGEVKEGGR